MATIVAGGVVGTVCRVLVFVAFESVGAQRFGWDGVVPATFVVNVWGAALLGWASRRFGRSRWRAPLSIGFCGGFTTMSTLAVDVVTIADGDGRWLAGIGYAAISVAAGLLAFVTGRRIGEAATP